MARTKTLYISDLDGTLLSSSAELSGFTANVINEMHARALHFTIATARTAATAEAIMSGARLGAPAVLMNGVLVYDASVREYVLTHYLPENEAAQVCAALKALKAQALMYTLERGELATYYESLESAHIRVFVGERERRYGKVFRQANDFTAAACGAIYFTLLDTYDKIAPVHDALSALPGISLAKYRDVYSDTLWYLEIFSGHASKRNAAGFLRERYGFERLVGFGDNLNDLPLFAACERKIAVSNARPEVLAAADEICGANTEDGVAKWLKANVLD